MSGATTALKSRITNSEYLGFCYPVYKDMFDNNMVFAFRGVVTSDLVAHVLEIMQEKLEEDQRSRKFSKKLSNVMVECLTNVYVDEELSQVQGYDPSALLIVKKLEVNYSILTGSYIHSSRVAPLKALMEKINTMTRTAIKEMYHDELAKDILPAAGPSNLSIIDLARKSGQRLNYSFKFENEHYSFFTLEAYILT